jgi:hypothetical protein
MSGLSISGIVVLLSLLALSCLTGCDPGTGIAMNLGWGISDTLIAGLSSGSFAYFDPIELIINSIINGVLTGITL